MTPFPFSIPEALRNSLPSPDRHGMRYADVKFHDRWDGILVIDRDFQCIGLHVNRRVEQHPLPFTVDDIQSFRPPCLANRLLASLPSWFDTWLASLIGTLLLSPLLIGLSFATSPWVCLLNIPIVVLSFMGMYSHSGFPLIRFPVASVGLGMLVASVIRIIRHVTIA